MILNFKQEEYEIFFTRPSMEINTNMHLLELSTMIHVRKQIKYILVNERPRDISRSNTLVTARSRLRRPRQRENLWDQGNDLMEELEITE